MLACEPKRYNEIAAELNITVQTLWNYRQHAEFNRKVGQLSARENRLRMETQIVIRFNKWFCCKKSGYFTKPVKNITNGIFICHKQVNNNTKSNSYSLKRQQNYFCNGTRIFIA